MTSRITGGHVAAYAESLAGCKRKGTAEQPAWYVRDRLVARLVNQDTLLVRVPLNKREDLLQRYPDSFGVPPRFEAHHKVEAYLGRADPDAIREAIRLAWDFQRSW